MSTSNVLPLQAHRDRRSQRLRLAESLYGSDSGRRALLRHVSAMATVVGADRAAVVWVDEYGPGLVHPHVVLDLLHDKPRRSFAVEPLRRAWDLGVPGALDEAGRLGQSTMAVALGSDGTRAWFLVAESVTGRPLLDSSARERIMFLAGECSAIVLHRDLDAIAEVEADRSEQKRGRFAGWAVLRDMEGRDAAAPEGLRITQRFAVARLARMLIDDDLTVAPERVVEQCRRARDEIATADVGLREAVLWNRVLDAAESHSLEALARSLVELGEEVEAVGHHHGALELYACAFDVAAATGQAFEAIEASRFSGRVYRRMAQWAEAQSRYEVAERIAEAAGHPDRVARSIAGQAIVHRERGNLPAARARLLSALEKSENGVDGDTLGSLYQDLVAVEQKAGDLPAALRYGWMSVRAYESEGGRVRGMASLGGVLAEAGETLAAEDAWMIVAKSSKDVYYRTYAWDALAYLAALRGDGRLFEARAARCDALGWREGAVSARVDILYHRGLALRALGRLADARSWLEETIAVAEEHGLGQFVFDAEEALGDLQPKARPAEHIHAAPAELRLELRERRVELAGLEV